MTTDTIHIREAVGDDAEALINLNKIYNGADYINTNISSVAHSLSDSPNEIVFVATKNSQVIGFACVLILESFCYQRPTFELTELFVKKEMRRMKVGSLLINKILEYAVEKEVLEVNLRVNKNNEKAIQFYKSCGLNKANHLVFRMKYY